MEVHSCFYCEALKIFVMLGLDIQVYRNFQGRAPKVFCLIWYRSTLMDYHKCYLLMCLQKMVEDKLYFPLKRSYKFSSDHYHQCHLKRYIEKSGGSINQKKITNLLYTTKCFCSKKRVTGKYNTLLYRSFLYIWRERIIL